MNEKIKEVLEKIPAVVLLIAYLGYITYDYYNFKVDPNSPLNQKKAEIVKIEEDVKKLNVRVRQVREFISSLDVKRRAIRELAQQLDATKSTLSETLDVPIFMKTVLTEAKRVGLTVVGLKPTDLSTKEYYIEQNFDFSFRGVFIQIFAFFNRLSNLEKIVRIDNFSLAPSSATASLAKFVEVGGKVQIRAYRYNGSKADALAKEKVRAAEALDPKALLINRGGSQNTPSVGSNPDKKEKTPGGK